MLPKTSHVDAYQIVGTLLHSPKPPLFWYLDPLGCMPLKPSNLTPEPSETDLMTYPRDPSYLIMGCGFYIVYSYIAL